MRSFKFFTIDFPSKPWPLTAIKMPIKKLPMSALVKEINDEGKLILFIKGPKVPKTSIANAINSLSLLFECDNAYSVLSFSECAET